MVLDKYSQKQSHQRQPVKHKMSHANSHKLGSTKQSIAEKSLQSSIMVGNQESTILEKRYVDTAPGTTSYKNRQKKIQQQITTSGEVEIVDGEIIGQSQDTFQPKTHAQGRRPVSAMPPRQGNFMKNQLYQKFSFKTIVLFFEASILNAISKV